MSRPGWTTNPERGICQLPGTRWEGYKIFLEKSYRRGRLFRRARLGSDGMPGYSRREFLESTVRGAAGIALTGGLGANLAAAGPFAPGVETVATALISGDERSRQADIWALEVHFKPVRMEYVKLPIPGGDGATQQSLVWYLCYRVINRQAPADAPVAEGADQTPAEPPLFVPELTLVAEGETSQKVYFDRVIPAAQAQILARERHPYKNNVDIVGPIPEPTPPGAKVEKSLDGIAIWRGVDPKTRFFTVFFSGFSNGYQVVKDPNGNDLIQRKTLMQKFWRPADEFDQKESEIRLKDTPRWVYR